MASPTLTSWHVLYCVFSCSENVPTCYERAFAFELLSFSYLSDSFSFVFRSKIIHAT